MEARVGEAGARTLLSGGTLHHHECDEWNRERRLGETAAELLIRRIQKRDSAIQTVFIDLSMNVGQQFRTNHARGRVKQASLSRALRENAATSYPSKEFAKSR
jgi:hypothetical protein